METKTLNNREPRSSYAKIIDPTGWETALKESKNDNHVVKPIMDAKTNKDPKRNPNFESNDAGVWQESKREDNDLISFKLEKQLKDQATLLFQRVNQSSDNRLCREPQSLQSVYRR